MKLELLPLDSLKRRRAAQPKPANSVSPDEALAKCAPPMTFHALIHFVMSTAPADWCADDSTGVFLCKRDLNIRIKRAKPDQRIFHEEWAMKYPSKDPHPQDFTLWYGSSPVKVYAFVSVDGYRADIPMPKLNTMNITREQYAVANIVNRTGELEASYYDRYIRKFNVVDEPPASDSSRA